MIVIKNVFNYTGFVSGNILFYGCSHTVQGPEFYFDLMQVLYSPKITTAFTFFPANECLKVPIELHAVQPSIYSRPFHMQVCVAC